MIINIDSKNGTNAQGARFREFVIYFVLCFFARHIIKFTASSTTTNPSAIYHISSPIYELIAKSTVQLSKNVAFKITKGLLISTLFCSVGWIFYLSCFLNKTSRSKNETTPQTTVGNAIFKKYVIKSIPANDDTYTFVGLPMTKIILHVFAATKVENT